MGKNFNDETTVLRAMVLSTPSHKPHAEEVRGGSVATRVTANPF